MRRIGARGIAAIGVLAACTTRSAKLTPAAPTATVVPLPMGAGGIEFDDMGFAPELRRIVFPAGRSGNLVLIDPDTRAITAINGFTAPDAGKGRAHRS